jgi:hypothetical protein
LAVVGGGVGFCVTGASVVSGFCVVDVGVISGASVVAAATVGAGASVGFFAGVEFFDFGAGGFGTFPWSAPTTGFPFVHGTLNKHAWNPSAASTRVIEWWAQHFPGAPASPASKDAPFVCVLVSRTFISHAAKDG